MNDQINDIVHEIKNDNEMGDHNDEEIDKE